MLVRAWGNTLSGDAHGISLSFAVLFTFGKNYGIIQPIDNLGFVGGNGNEMS